VTYATVCRRAEGLCELQCVDALCGATVAWPTKPSEFDAAVEAPCERCGGARRLCWRTAPTSSAAAAATSAAVKGASEVEEAAASAVAPTRGAAAPLALGADVLGPSFAESYHVWYALCGRAVIGNFAYEAGREATVAAAVAALESEALSE